MLKNSVQEIFHLANYADTCPGTPASGAGNGFLRKRVKYGKQCSPAVDIIIIPAFFLQLLSYRFYEMST